MVKMRLKRMGQKKAPFYRIVVADSRSPRDGRFIEEVGYYDPNTEPSTIKIDEEAAKKWLATGAQPTETVGKLFKNRWYPVNSLYETCLLKACFIGRLRSSECGLRGEWYERISGSDCKSAGRQPR